MEVVLLLGKCVALELEGDAVVILAGDTVHAGFDSVEARNEFASAMETLVPECIHRHTFQNSSEEYIQAWGQIVEEQAAAGNCDCAIFRSSQNSIIVVLPEGATDTYNAMINSPEFKQMVEDRAAGKPQGHAPKGHG